MVTNDAVYELVEGRVLEAIEDGAAAAAMHGLKNELARLHVMHRLAYEGDASREEIWTRILVIQEALLDVARMIVSRG